MKLKNVFSKGRMNKDFDERLIPEGEYTDALNIRVVNTGDGDAGAIQNEEGNTRLTNISAGTGPRCIGAVPDESNEKIYWFVTNAFNHGYIFEYDIRSQATRTILKDTRSAATNVLGFDAQYKVYGNVIYNVSKKETILLFTDGKNSPKLVNVERAITYGENGFFEDDISLYRKPPAKAPTVRPFFTTTKKENQIQEQFFAFAYRYKYLDNQYSALSSFSNYQFNPGGFSIDYGTMENKGMIGIYNGFNITYNTGDDRVTDIDICFKNTKHNTVYVIDTINKKESDFGHDMSKTYQFKNRMIFKALPEDEVFRIFDDVPLTAKTQDFIKDRIVFGNTTSQYDMLENSTDELPLKLDFNVEHVSTSFAGDFLTTSINTSGDSTELTITFTDIVFTVDSELIINIELTSPSASYLSQDYGNGTAVFTAGVVLSQTYSGLSSFLASDDWTTFMGTLTANFASIATVTVPLNNTLTSYGNFTHTSTSTTVVIKAPKITFTVDTTPSDTTDNVTTQLENQFTWQNTVQARWTTLNSSLSLKSNRSYEFGIVYLDEFGRYSSVLLPKESESSGNSEIFVPVSDSENQNRAKITINSKPPYWANRYKFFVKQNKEVYYNIFATIFYEEGIYRWVSLEGNNIGKVEAGTMLIVKSDDTGPLNSLVKCKVLAVENKSAQDALNAQEGWIEGNDDPAGNPVVERAGVYMKIKPSGFKMDWNPNNFISYDNSEFLGFAKSGVIKVILPKENPQPVMGFYAAGGEKELGFLQVLNAAGNAYDDQTLNPGSILEFDFHFDGYNEDDSFSFKKKYTVQNTYTSSNTVSAFELWADAETTWAKTSFTTSSSNSGYIGDYGGQTVNKFFIPAQDDTNPVTEDGFHFFTVKQAHPLGAPWTDRFLLHVEPSEHTAFFERGRLTCKLDIILVDGITIFETDPMELNSDIYYETDETFNIESGLHQGSEQNQSNSQPAITQLNFGNCFSFGNAVESISVRDDRFEPYLDIDTRPNVTLLEGFERLESRNKLIYSGGFNENNAYNTLNEFNASRGITKFMDMKYGSVQRVHSRESDLIVFQEDRVSKVLYGKNIINAPDGTGSLTQIEQVLGQDVPFTGEYGIGLSPESFASYENSLYFADPNRGAVLRLGQQGITPISAQGMKSYFKSTLYANRNHFNPGGYDPKHNQYVLTPGESAKTVAAAETTCNSEITARVSQTYTYTLKVTQPGTHTLAYNVSAANVNISINYNGSTTNHNGLFGSGNLTFGANPSSDPTAVITITAAPTENQSSVAYVTIHNQCPEPETMNVTILVVNDAYQANETIINRFKNSGVNVFNEVTDTFDASGTTRFETFSGDMGTTAIPQNGDTVTISSLRVKQAHTGDFNPCNDLGYWITASANPTVSDILTNANFSGSVTNSETTSMEENVLQFTFNRSNTNENLFIVYDYRDVLPVLVGDAITGISNGGSSTVNVVSNDTIPSPYTLTIENPPSNGTATIVSGSPTTSITYSHTAGADLTDTFTYKVSRGGTCEAVCTVTTQALAITQNTYIYIYFDASGSMNNTLIALREMQTNSLKAVLQDLYATGGTASSGNTNNATNGSDAYDSHVSIVYEDDNDNNTKWQNERTWAALSDNDVNDFLSNGHNNFPADADNVVFLLFQDEAQGSQGADYHDNPADGQIQGSHATDIATLRSRINTLNSSNNNFYRGVVFQVEGANNSGFKAYLQAVQGSTGNFSGTSGLNDYASGSTNYLGFTYDIEDAVVSSGSTLNNSVAPYKPGSSSDRFDKWEYYYLYHVTNELKDLGFDNNGALGWPIIKDD